MKEVTQAQIDKWKKEHGSVFLLETDDGKKAYIKDPLSDFLTVKQAFAALEKAGAIGMAVTYLNNCWLDGDAELKTDESYGNGLADQLDQLAELPDFRVEHKDTHFEISSEGEVLRVRGAKRADILAAENRNDKGEPFMTAVYLLKSICVDQERLSEVKKNTRAYLGMLRGTNKVKDKAYVAVKKL